MPRRLVCWKLREVLKINQKITGKGTSIQAYNISPKIKAVDEWLNEKPNGLDIYEAHPELCFKTLNKNIDLEYSKHDKSGVKGSNCTLSSTDQLRCLFLKVSDFSGSVIYKLKNPTKPL